MPSWLMQLPSAEIVIVAMAFAWGSILGSFANVVLHRLPRGESVARERSRCPACGAAVRPRDNVPVFGWILLGGRCRDCRTPIAIRYPLVEAACGGIAAIVASGDLAGTAVAPLLDSGRSGIDRLLLSADWRLVVAWLMHAVSLIAVTVWALLDWDAQRNAAADPGASSLGSAACPGAAGLVLTALLLTTCVPGIGPRGLDASMSSEATSPAARFAAAAVGLLAGRILGGITGRPADRCGLALLGAVTGWQAVTVVAVVTMPLTRLGRGIWPHVATALVATAVTAAWRPLCLVAEATWNATFGG
jgi:leader peptidase (prepilin peptidase)/N-methyltransferase